MPADQAMNRICACGASFASSHADICLKCMVAGVGKPKGKPKSVATPIAPPAVVAATNGTRAKSKALKQPKNLGVIAPPSGVARRVVPVAPVPRGIYCVLCGELVPKGALLRHKHDRHGEKEITPSPAQAHRAGWIKVVQGGLPSLGKNSR